VIFKLLSVLLGYPDDAVLEYRKDIAEAVRELPPSPSKEAMTHFLRYWENEDGARLQRAYTSAFDFSRRGNLYLTYYRYGDARLRGEALSEMKEAYARAGYELSTGELPDYLPLVLEFASCEAGEGKKLLAESRGSIELIRRSLHKDGSPYALLLDALCEVLPGLDASEVDELRSIIMQGPPQETVGLEPYGSESPSLSPNVAFYGRKR
jgi:nitrate reductase molybdenum cofactor assembly chaperone NarJ/NarW